VASRFRGNLERERSLELPTSTLARLPDTAHHTATPKLYMVLRGVVACGDHRCGEHPGSGCRRQREPGDTE